MWDKEAHEVVNAADHEIDALLDHLEQNGHKFHNEAAVAHQRLQKMLTGMKNLPEERRHKLANMIHKCVTHLKRVEDEFDNFVRDADESVKELMETISDEEVNAALADSFK